MSINNFSDKKLKSRNKTDKLKNKLTGYLLLRVRP